MLYIKPCHKYKQYPFQPCNQKTPYHFISTTPRCAATPVNRQTGEPSHGFEVENGRHEALVTWHVAVLPWGNLVTTNQFSGGFSFQRKDWEKVTKSAWPMSLRGGQGHFTYLVALISLRSHLFLPESFRKISEFVGEMSAYLVISNGTVEPCHDSQGERLTPPGSEMAMACCKGDT